MREDTKDTIASVVAAAASAENSAKTGAAMVMQPHGARELTVALVVAAHECLQGRVCVAVHHGAVQQRGLVYRKASKAGQVGGLVHVGDGKWKDSGNMGRA